ncbi:MAG: signal peptidase I, partial [Planctomycetales bacterium]
MSPESRYHPWIACALSLCCTGLGHLYVGRLLRGLTLFLMSLILIPAAALVAGMTSSTGALVGLRGAMGVLVVLWIVAVLDAGRIAAKTPRTAPHDYQRPLVYGLFLVAGLCAPALSVAYVRQNLLEAFYIPTKSMAPTLHSGDRILVNKAVWRREQLDRDDVVVFRYPDQRDRNYVKRIIGMPGDVVTIDG